MGGKENCLI
jgi:hypothetical protein